MRACLWSRTAMRVLAPLAAFPCPDAAALYDGVRTVDWTEWLTVKTTLAVDATGTAPGLHHTGFVALKVKDGVVDSLRDALGGRPDVDTRDPDVRIVLHLVARAGRALARPLRRAALPARLPEHGARRPRSRRRWPPPCWRSGEVGRRPPLPRPALRLGHAGHRAGARRPAGSRPGLERAFGFQRWPRYRGEWQSAWDRMKEEARRAALPRAPAPIRASDRDEEALDAARRNARAAGVEADIEIAARRGPHRRALRRAAGPSAPTRPTGSGSAASRCSWPGSTAGSPRPSSASTAGACSSSPAIPCWSGTWGCAPSGPTGSGTAHSR